MKNVEFVSVEESALENVAGGLADILNGSVNNNQINVLSGITLNTAVGDVGSYLLNILNDVGCAVGPEGPIC